MNPPLLTHCARPDPRATLITDPESSEAINGFYDSAAIPADSFARAVYFAISQPADVDINEILYRPTAQAL